MYVDEKVSFGPVECEYCGNNIKDPRPSLNFRSSIFEKSSDDSLVYSIELECGEVIETHLKGDKYDKNSWNISKKTCKHYLQNKLREERLEDILNKKL